MSTISSGTFADLLWRSPRDDASRVAFRRHARQAIVPLAVAAALAGAWCAVAPLSGAVVAPAHLKVELNRKTVQHQEGGTVREVLVRDGQRVRAGDPLVVIGDVRGDASLGLAREQLYSEKVRKARAMAEAALQPALADDAGVPRTPSTAEYWLRERALFAARRRMLDEHVAALQSQVREAQAQVAALQAQIEATETSARLSAEEVEINDKLVRQGFVQRTRMISLQRAEADYRARVAEYRSELAVARQRIADLQSRLVQARNQYQGQAADELKEATAKVRELEERLRPSQDQVERQVVRSPVDGEVMAMRVSPGAVVGPREPILDVVPADEKIVVEARVRPQDVDHVRRHAPADVRLGAFASRDTPLLSGTVVFVSPDRVSGPSGGDAWFVATVEIDPQAVARHADLRLHAGMPAEVYVKTPERTVLEYLSRPVRDFSNRAMREP